MTNRVQNTPQKIMGVGGGGGAFQDTPSYSRASRDQAAHTVPFTKTIVCPPPPTPVKISG